MQVLQQAVSDNLLYRCNQEIDHYLKAHERVWSASNTTWSCSLYEGIDGTCLAATPSQHILIKIRAAIVDLLPPTKIINLNYHYWNKGSGINWHTDEGHVFAATLYLNDWNKRWGGLFLYNGKWLCPKAGTLVINDKLEEHCVTPTTRHNRRTVQIWGK